MIYSIDLNSTDEMKNIRELLSTAKTVRVSIYGYNGKKHYAVEMSQDDVDPTAACWPNMMDESICQCPISADTFEELAIWYVINAGLDISMLPVIDTSYGC